MPKGTCTPMFTEAHFTIVRTWKQSKCSSTEEWIKKMQYTYTKVYYSAIKRNKIGSFAEMWMDVETVMQSEVSQKEKNKNCLLTICGIQKNGTDGPICKAGIDRQTEWTCGHEVGVKERVGRMGRLGLTYILYSTSILSSQEKALELIPLLHSLMQLVLQADLYLKSSPYELSYFHRRIHWSLG